MIVLIFTPSAFNAASASVSEKVAFKACATLASAKCAAGVPVAPAFNCAAVLLSTTPLSLIVPVRFGS
jgi:hypothetical protein